MDRSYFLKNPIRVARLSRLIAKGIDLFIVLMLIYVLYPFGVILSVVYFGMCDSFLNGQSVGKRVMGFRVISLEDGTACSLKQSIIRNLPLIIPISFSIIPAIGWIFSLGIGIIAIGIEIFLIFKLDSGYRMGDVLADTSVMGNDLNKTVNDKRRDTSWFSESGAGDIC